MTAAQSLSKILDGLAWMLGALALGFALVCATAIVLLWSFYLYQGHSLPNLIWTFSDPLILKGMADIPPPVLLLALSAIALAFRGRTAAARLDGGLGLAFRELGAGMPRARRGARGDPLCLPLGYIPLDVSLEVPIAIAPDLAFLTLRGGPFTIIYDDCLR